MFELSKKITTTTILVISVFLLTSCNNSKQITNFEECIAAGNPAMESYPRQCRAGDRTFTEEIPSSIGKYCDMSSDCRVPMEYMIQSNCPYQAFCRSNKCVVACPMWEHSPNPKKSISYQVGCSNDSDCDCSVWDIEEKYPCECLGSQCASVVETEENMLEK
jgi:hypothetical protein